MIDRETAQVVRGQDLACVAHLQHGGVITRLRQHIPAHGNGQGSERGFQAARPELGPAAPTHGPVAQNLADPRCHFPWQIRNSHRRQIAKLVHEFLVNPILPTPKRGTRADKSAFLGQCAFAAQRDQLEVVALRTEG